MFAVVETLGESKRVQSNINFFPFRFSTVICFAFLCNSKYSGKMREETTMALLVFLMMIMFTWPMRSSAQVTSCPSSCGNVEIPFPFGVGASCSVDDYWFKIDCKDNKPLLESIDLEVLEISLEGTIRVNHPIFSACRDRTSSNVNLEESPFSFSQNATRFTGIGCNNLAFMSSINSVIGGCMSICDQRSSSDTTEVNGCYGIKCCQTTVPSYLKLFNATVSRINENESNDGCQYAFLVEQEWFQRNLMNRQEALQNMTHVPAVLDWGIYDYAFNLYARNKSTAYNGTSSCEIYVDARLTNNNISILRCSCNQGYRGNPYLLEGCQDIDECKEGKCPPHMACENFPGFYYCYAKNPKKNYLVTVFSVVGGILGLLLILFGSLWSYKVVKKKRIMKQKEKFFKQNGGLLLQQQLSSGEANVEKINMFNSKELEKATNSFSVDRMLGQGGQGTVYKGMLADGRIVAVKKSKVVDEGQVDQFINEVVILSQTSHRNVVRLLGCCLETEVPLLVYEFVPNGTLYQYIHDQNDEFPLTWERRLQIATEVAGALSYLHSSVSLPIYHRDIKSSNILLDDKYRAKIADFGTSRTVALDQTHVTTRVQGTFGYLDPEYFQSNQFTDKSDVYSFGVVLVELLTGKKAVQSIQSQEYKSLVSLFILSLEENNLFDILDAQVIKQGQKEHITAVADLARRCLYLNGKRRPTMKEVTKELEGIQASQNPSGVPNDYDERPVAEMVEVWDSFPASITSSLDSSGVASSSEKSPFLFTT
ncbi:wall-associated receptor kinase-like 22 [Tripterygium wilfordii]|uniref:Wall-associated receptor kinase-like 22 n=1 Tax=Tripterygium wilfordii TaxID=458696 RepID=A0A7J7CEG4_TRIWF|nr:wall-associated receptor kinase-like 8 [Tripterygium wilfordii]KAF5732523.1 wall-associated receptor kinase-like 22 [Tripterygium wilfordii]